MSDERSHASLVMRYLIDHRAEIEAILEGSIIITFQGRAPPLIEIRRRERLGEAEHAQAADGG